jgi:hypothetical protein
MCLAAGGAKIAVKLRSVELVNKVKFLPVFINSKLQAKPTQTCYQTPNANL